MRKVLFVTTIYKTFESFLIPHANYLKLHNFEVDLATNLMDFNSNKQIESVSNMYDVPFPRRIKLLRLIKSYRIINKLLINNYDYIYLHTPIASFITRLTIRNNKTRSKIIYFVHGFHFHAYSRKLNWLIYYPIELFLSKVTDTFVTINQEDFLIAQGKFKRPTYFIPGVGINVNGYKNVAKKNNDLGLKLLTIGELNSNKNHYFIINNLIKHKEKDWVLYICGEGPLHIYLEKLIKKKALQNKIFLLGYCQDVSKYLLTSDIYIHSSKREGLPVSIIEAMHFGLPILASDIRGNRDLIEETSGNMLYKGNDSNDFIEKLTSIINLSSESKLHIHAQNKKLSLKYSFKNIEKYLVDIFDLETNSTEKYYERIKNDTEI